MRRFYAAVDAAGGRPAGRGSDVFKFMIGSVEASVDLHNGTAEAIAKSTPETQPDPVLPRGIMRFGDDQSPYEPEFEISPILRHDGAIWAIEPLSEARSRRAQDINAAVEIFRTVAREFQSAIRRVFDKQVVKLYVRMSSTSGFEEVYPDAIPHCWLDLSRMRLRLEEGDFALQAVFSPARTSARRALPDRQPTEQEIQRGRKIAEAIFEEWADTAWAGADVVSLIQELVPALDARTCSSIFDDARARLSETSRWHKGGRPSTKPLRATVEPVLVRRGIIPKGDDGAEQTMPAHRTVNPAPKPPDRGL